MTGSTELQVFISYAHADDALHDGAHVGWVSGFVDHLKKVVRHCAGWPVKGRRVPVASEPPGAVENLTPTVTGLCSSGGGAARMLSKLSIKNYKSVLDQTIELGRVNVFIGENATGKTHAMKAIGATSKTGASGITVASSSLCPTIQSGAMTRPRLVRAPHTS